MNEKHFFFLLGPLKNENRAENYWNLLLFLAEARPHPVHLTVRGHQKSVQIPRSIVISKKISRGFLLTTEKGQRKVYSQAVFWHNTDGGLRE